MDGPGPQATAKMLNHLALHYRPGDSETVVNLFVAMGLRVEDLGPARNGDRLFKVYVQNARDDGYFFVTSAAKPQLDFEARLAAACSASLEAYREARRIEPETSFHIGVRYESLEALERAVLRLQSIVADDPVLARRLNVNPMKAQPGNDPAVAERMAASAVFRDVERESYVVGLVQVFVQTDLVAGGPLAIGQTFEMDYVFPDQTSPFVPIKVYDVLD